jgi:hypothetical protein
MERYGVIRPREIMADCLAGLGVLKFTPTALFPLVLQTNLELALIMNL